jgi:DNA (cytosine-5)-methyltransferase 1
MERWLWPTPTVNGNYNAKGASKKSGDGLATAVKKEGLWPTPLTRDYKGGRSPETLKAKGRTPTNSLPDSVTHQEGQSGPLNPQWVEWLMGFPIGWTESKP